MQVLLFNNLSVFLLFFSPTSHVPSKKKTVKGFYVSHDISELMLMSMHAGCWIQ